MSPYESFTYKMVLKGHYVGDTGEDCLAHFLSRPSGRQSSWSGCACLTRTDFLKIYSLEGCSHLKRPDFRSLLLWENVVALKALSLDSSIWEGIVNLKGLILNKFQFGWVWLSCKD